MSSSELFKENVDDFNHSDEEQKKNVLFRIGKINSAEFLNVLLDIIRNNIPRATFAYHNQCPCPKKYIGIFYLKNL